MDMLNRGKLLNFLFDIVFNELVHFLFYLLILLSYAVFYKFKLLFALYFCV